MEFLRFGSRISGSGIGCCAFDILQGFDSDPDAKASVQLVDGDGAYPLIDRDTGTQLFAGPTNKDIFFQRLRIGTFSKKELPNHGFLAVVTENQLTYGFGKQWLKLLKEAGFEFIRAVDNSVYSTRRINYLFALFRNASDRGVMPNEPPEEWGKLPENTLSQQDLWATLPNKPLLTEEELRKAGVPVYLAGTRGKQPKIKEPTKEEKVSPWNKKSPALSVEPLSLQTAKSDPAAM